MQKSHVLNEMLVCWIFKSTVACSSERASEGQQLIATLDFRTKKKQTNKAKKEKKEKKEQIRWNCLTKLNLN